MQNLTCRTKSRPQAELKQFKEPSTSAWNSPTQRPSISRAPQPAFLGHPGQSIRSRMKKRAKISATIQASSGNLNVMALLHL